MARATRFDVETAVTYTKTHGLDVRQQMAPPLVDDGGDGGRQKNSRKIKRLRDASCMRKRETRQDKWGRQRGGRKARWDKLDRHPSALKSTRLGAGALGNPNHQFHLDESFVDAAAAASPRTPNGHATGGDVGLAVGNGNADVDDDSLLNSPIEVDISTSSAGLNTPSAYKQEHRKVDGTLPQASGEGTSGSDDSSGIANATAATVTPTKKSLGGTPKGQRAASGGRGREQRTGVLGSGGSRGSSRRSALRSSPSSSSTGIGGLSRSASGFHLEGGRLVGKFRGSPPPLHRRLSAPTTADRRTSTTAGSKGAKGGTGRRHVGRQQQGQGLHGAKQGPDVASAWQDEGGDEEDDARTPPLPPSLFDSVFKNKLPSLTPRKAPPVTPRLSKDSIVHAIFQSLFGKRRVRSGPRERYGGDWDDVDDDDDGDGDGRHPEEEEVDESWIKTGISLSLFNSQALDFACRSTAGADLLHEYVDSNAVFRLVTDLRFEDPRVPSPRLMIIKAIYENCAHLRLPTLRALAHASHDHLMRTRELEAWAARAGIDMGEVAAAAVADGGKLSIKPGIGGNHKIGTIRAPAGGLGSALGVGGGAGTSVRVTGRDQSQTLAELLVFTLQTFPKYFLGMVDCSEGNAGAGEALPGSDMTDQAAVAEPQAPAVPPFSSVCDNGEEDFLQPPDTAEGFPVEVDVPLDCEGRGGWSSASPEAEIELPEATAVAAPSGAWSESNGSSVLACGGGATEDTDSEIIVRDFINSSKSNGCFNAGGPGDEKSNVATSAGAVATEELDNNIGNVEVAGSLAQTRGSDDATSNDGSVPRAEAPMMPAEGDVDGEAWPTLRESPKRDEASQGSTLNGSLVAPATPKTPVLEGAERQASELLDCSPAGAITTGVRELEDQVSGQSNVWEDGNGRGNSSGFPIAGGGDGKVWGGRSVGNVPVHLAWGVGSMESIGNGREVDGARAGEAGPARTLKFTFDEEDVDETGAVDNMVKSDATSREAGGNHDPFDGSDRKVEHQEAGVPPEGLAFDQLASSAPPQSALPGATPSASPPPSVSEQLPQPPPELGQQAAAQPAPFSAGATAQALAVGVNPGADAPGASGWPAVALKEAARSLCNLYASHGAPAAGGEAAASADIPERLQPLAAAGSTLCQIWPPASAILFRRLLGTWPVGCSKREVAYLRLIAGVACAAPPVEVMCPGSRIPLMLFRRISRCINSPNTKVAQEAAYLVQADFMVMGYLAPNRRLMDLVTNALCTNRDHWSADVRNASDQSFDIMLDFL